ncbi:MAG TPA: HEAT repeat domain-containing protein [Planctomycetaceae bacterium]
MLLALLLTGCWESRTERSIRLLREGDAETRRQAARDLGETESRPAVETVPGLAAALGDSDPDVRRLAAFALGRLGPEADDALPALRTALADEQEPVRLAAAYAINGIDPTDEAVVPVLAAAARRGEVRAIVALGRMGPHAAAAAPDLARALRSRMPLVRVKSAEALGAIGPAAKASAPALRRALGDPDDDVRLAAEAALRSIEPGP